MIGNPDGTDLIASPAPSAIKLGFSLLTYATHSEGTLPHLLEKAPSIVVGGWGKRWKRYDQKLEFVLDYARRSPAEHIIIFVDGFDTELKLPPEEAVKRFRSLRVPFLVSSWGAESVFPELVVRRAFACGNAECVNSGMYMGYANTVQTVLEAALTAQDTRGDDQRALELARLRLQHLVKVDSGCRVFLNMNSRERARGLAKDADPVFVGRNGASWSRGPKALAKQSGHFSRLLVIDVGACILAVALGLLWGSLDLPTFCAKFPLFPFVVGLCCLFSPHFSVSVASALFLLSIFTVCHGCTARGAAECATTSTHN